MELVNIQAVQNTALTIFTTESGAQPYVEQVIEMTKTELNSIFALEQEGKLEEAMKLRKRLGTNVNKSKTALDDVGGDLYKKLSAEAKLVSAERSRIRGIFDDLRAKVLAPVKEYEEAEKARLSVINDRLDGIKSLPETLKAQNASSALIQERILEISTDTFDYQEKAEEANSTRFVTIQYLNKLNMDAIDREAAEREAEEKRMEAEKIAEAERQEKLRIEAEENAKKAVEAQIRAVEEKALQAERDKAQAELQKSEAMARVEKEKEQAILAERARAERQAQAELEEAKRREADKEHRAWVNNSALEGIVGIGFTEEQAREIVRAIAQNKIPYVSINY